MAFYDAKYTILSRRWFEITKVLDECGCRGQRADTVEAGQDDKLDVRPGVEGSVGDKDDPAVQTLSGFPVLKFHFWTEVRSEFAALHSYSGLFT